jgi:hypothetical protein
MSNGNKQETWFEALRQKRSTPGGRLTFVGLRGAEYVHPFSSTTYPSFACLRKTDVLLRSPLIQHQLLTAWGPQLLNKLGYPIRSTIAAARTGYHSLTPIQILFIALSSGSALKQSIWVGMVDQAFPVAPAVAVSIYNTLLNSVNAIVMLYTTQVCLYSLSFVLGLTCARF